MAEEEKNFPNSSEEKKKAGDAVNASNVVEPAESADKSQVEQADITREFEENPYQTDKKKPEDIVRLFYVHNVPVIPVISKRGLLIGVLRKQDLVSELSDIERNEKIKIDEFVTRLARKMSLDELLKYGSTREFIVINIFGDVLGRWSRLQLFNAAEPGAGENKPQDDVEAQREEQVLEWIIYLILEHIPRALYALNEKGKTIFYNSLFEDIYSGVKKGDVDAVRVEKCFSNPNDNDLYSGSKGDDILFYNRELDVVYEKIPLSSNGKKVGFLIFCENRRDVDEGNGMYVNGVSLQGMSLSDALAAVERQLIVSALKSSNNTADAAKCLKLSRQALTSRMKKHKITDKNS